MSLVKKISSRYYIAVAELRVFDLLERLGNLLRAAEREAAAGAGLLPVHLSMLRYLARANRYSNTPAAVAEYLETTKGTTSQSLLVLERKRYIAKNIDRFDRRVVRLTVATEGARLLARLAPPEPLRQAFAELSDQAVADLESRLSDLLLAMQRTNSSRSFGVCRTCRFFERKPDGFRCGLTEEPLSVADSIRICREHEESDIKSSS